MTRYNLSQIMTTAHNYRKEYGVPMNDALRAAWLKAKQLNVAQAMDATGYDPADIINRHNFTWQQKEEYQKLGYQLRALRNKHDIIINPYRYAA